MANLEWPTFVKVRYIFYSGSVYITDCIIELEDVFLSLLFQSREICMALNIKSLHSFDPPYLFCPGRRTMVDICNYMLTE